MGRVRLTTEKIEFAADSGSAAMARADLGRIRGCTIRPNGLIDGGDLLRRTHEIAGEQGNLIAAVAFGQIHGLIGMFEQNLWF